MIELNTIHCMNCIDLMAAMPDGFVDLTVTSPPYNCGKNYGPNTDDRLSWDDYWAFTHSWVSKCFAILKDGGRLAVNIPWWIGSKPRRDAEYEFKKVVLGSGFLFLDKIIWIKGDAANVHTSGGFGGGGSGWGTYLSPSGPAIRCASEPILIFAKGSRGRRVVSGEGRGACVRGDITRDEFHEWTIDTWFVRNFIWPRSPDNHPAAFTDEIPKRLIKLYTFPGELIYDPFMGSGTTAIAAHQLKRHWIGSEISPEYVELANKRLEPYLAQEQLF